jgi:glycosyltransferase involved in cell wall biosynthesis
MRVAIIITRPVLLGPSIVMKSLVTSLSGKENLRVELYCLGKPKEDEEEFDCHWLKFNLSKFRFEDYDIIHTNGIKPDMIAFFFRKRIRRHISTIHSLVTEEFLLTRNRLFSVVFSKIWLLCWKRADKLVCVSNSVKNYCSKSLPSGKLEVIHNGIPEKVNRVEPDHDMRMRIDHFRNRGLKVIGTAAILTRLKNTQILLELVAARSEFACVVIGNGKELGKLKELAEKLDISNRCFFAGFRKVAANYFRYFDFFISASLSEGFGLTVVEAVRERIPVVCSAIPAFRELFTEDEVTFFNPFDCNSLSAALDIASVKGKGKSEAAYSAFRVKYTETYMGLNYYEHYKSLCIQKPS